MARFGSVVTAMVTPFHPDGDIDLDMAGQVARHLAATGSNALVVAGTTGEGPVLTDAERLDLFRAVVEVVDVPVIASTGTNDTAAFGAVDQGGQSLWGQRGTGRHSVLQPAVGSRTFGPLPRRGCGYRSSGRAL